MGQDSGSGARPLRMAADGEGGVAGEGTARGLDVLPGP